MMIEVELPIEQWQQVLAILSQGQWGQVNGLIMAIGEQLRAQAPRPNGPDPDARPEPIRQ